MIKHERKLIVVTYHIGPKDVALQRYKIFLDLGKSSQPFRFSLFGFHLHTLNHERR